MKCPTAFLVTLKNLVLSLDEIFVIFNILCLTGFYYFSEKQP